MKVKKIKNVKSFYGKDTGLKQNTIFQYLCFNLIDVGIAGADPENFSGGGVQP